MQSQDVSSCPVAIGQLLAGKYRVDRVLGIGGMGVVVAATHVALGQRVALKFMLPSALESADSAGRFLREARAAVRLRSEHVARVLDIGTLDSGSPYIVMEYLEGEDLSALIQRSGVLPMEQAIEVVLQACDALAEAHALGMVHRDLKPANLFVTNRPYGSSLVKVLDFGISKSTDVHDVGLAVTRTATVMGSPLYMSPEQMKSARDVDSRSDIWALGVILFEATTGMTPFPTDSLGTLMAAVLGIDPIVRVDAVRPNLGVAFGDVVARCLERDRTLRFQNVAELARALMPLAPESIRPLALRVCRVQGISSPDSFVSPPSSRTVPMFGRTPLPSVSTGRVSSPDASRRRAGPLVVALASLVLAGGAGTLLLSRRSPASRTGDGAQASMSAASDAPQASALTDASAVELTSRTLSLPLSEPSSSARVAPPATVRGARPVPKPAARAEVVPASASVVTQPPPVSSASSPPPLKRELFDRN